MHDLGEVYAGYGSQRRESNQKVSDLTQRRRTERESSCPVVAECRRRHAGISTARPLTDQKKKKRKQGKKKRRALREPPRSSLCHSSGRSFCCHFFVLFFLSRWCARSVDPPWRVLVPFTSPLIQYDAFFFLLLFDEEGTGWCGQRRAPISEELPYVSVDIGTPSPIPFAETEVSLCCPPPIRHGWNVSH